MPDLEDFIRDVPDFPKEGIIFKDITPLLAHCGAMRDKDAAQIRSSFGTIRD